MIREWKLGLLFAVLIPVVVFASSAGGPPSDGAKEMAGVLGTDEYKPADWTGSSDPGKTRAPKTFWKDTDGVGPGSAGCHVGQTAAGKPNGRTFGEGCLANGLLIESNPGADELHSHSNDIGHPDTFDCALWCVGEGHSGGICEASPAPPCEMSARCMCS